MALFDLDGVCPKVPQSGRYWVAENATVLGNVIADRVEIENGLFMGGGKVAGAL